VIYTIVEDDDNLFDAICSGADGYILKTSTAEDLRQALIHVNQGGAAMTPSITKRVLARFAKIAPNNNTSGYKLTKREKEVLTLLVKGYSYKMIAAELDLGLETIRTYVKRTYNKLHVYSMSAAVVKAVTEKLV
jgi:DNA-binding NarL/FixJ family response regulator